jgi:hypothetical protein
MGARRAEGEEVPIFLNSVALMQTVRASGANQRAALVLSVKGPL